MFNKKEYDKKHYQENREKIIERVKKWYKNNPEKVKQYCESHSEIRNERSRQYIKNHIEEHRKYDNEWHKNNTEHRNIYNKNRYRTDLKFNLSIKISSLINYTLKGNKEYKHWEDLVGYSVSDLVRHLKSTIPEGYIWQDYMEGRLHVDHIIPIDVFNFTKSEHSDFKRCWALSNLRLLPAKENIRKGNKLYKPFQPSLAF